MSVDAGTQGTDEGNEGRGKGRKARARRYKEFEIDWDGISADLSRARPRQISEKEALERIAEDLVAQHRRGITAEQMAEILGKRGLVVDADRVREVLRDFGGRSGSAEIA